MIILYNHKSVKHCFSSHIEIHWTIRFLSQISQDVLQLFLSRSIEAVAIRRQSFAILAFHVPPLILNTFPWILPHSCLFLSYFPVCFHDGAHERLFMHMPGHGSPKVRTSWNGLFVRILETLSHCSLA